MLNPDMLEDAAAVWHDVSIARQVCGTSLVVKTALLAITRNMFRLKAPSCLLTAVAFRHARH
jgi:hypothetical protein